MVGIGVFAWVVRLRAPRGQHGAINGGQALRAANVNNCPGLTVSRASRPMRAAPALRKGREGGGAGCWAFSKHCIADDVSHAHTLVKRGHRHTINKAHTPFRYFCTSIFNFP